MNKKALAAIMVAAPASFVADRLLKWMALNEWNTPKLPNKFFGWEPFANPGVAFGIPLPNQLIIAFSIIVLSLIGYVSYRQLLSLIKRSTNSPLVQPFSLALIFFGALSNLIDRMSYQHTIDYLRFFTSVINLADVMIVIGFVIYLIEFNAPNKN